MVELKELGDIGVTVCLGLSLGAGLAGLVACIGDLVAKFRKERKESKEFQGYLLTDDYGTRIKVETFDEVLDWLPYCRGEIMIEHKGKIVPEENLWKLLDF